MKISYSVLNWIRFIMAPVDFAGTEDAFIFGFCTDRHALSAETHSLSL